MTVSTDLIVLHSTKYGENALVVHTLGPVYGRRSFLVRIGGRSAPVSPALFLPLNILNGQVTENPRSELWTLRSPMVKHPLSGIRDNLYKNTMTLFLSEVLYRAVRDGAYEAGLYEWCERQVLTLNALEDSFSNFHLLFLLGLSGALGFRPETGDLAPFAGGMQRHIEALLRLPFSEALLYPLTGAERSDLADVFLRYLEFHTESALRVRSLAVLKEIFH